MGLFTNTIAYEVADKLSRLNDTLAFNYSFDNSEAKRLIIELNTEDQLYKKGIDSKGIELGNYSDFTTILKIAKGERFDHITLKDTGDFYESFRVYVYGGDLVINANTIKEDTDLIKEYGEDILGLTEENLIKIQEFAKNKYIEYVWKKITE